MSTILTLAVPTLSKDPMLEESTTEWLEADTKDNAFSAYIIVLETCRKWIEVPTIEWTTMVVIYTVKHVIQSRATSATLTRIDKPTRPLFSPNKCIV